MSMVKCPECDKDISSYANNCPYCGLPKEMFSTVKQEKKVLESSKVAKEAFSKLNDEMKFALKFAEWEDYEGFDLDVQNKYIKRYLNDSEKLREQLFKAYNVDTTEKFVEKYGIWDIIEFAYGCKVEFNEAGYTTLSEEELHAERCAWYDIGLSVYKDQKLREEFVNEYLVEEEYSEEYYPDLMRLYMDITSY